MLMPRLLAFLLLLFAGPALVPAALPAETGRKIALVVGNDAYTRIPRLERAGADARLVASTLAEIGFSVTLRTDLGHRDFLHLAADFTSSIQPGDTVFVFFAGHGIARAGVNYLLPVDISPDDAANDLLLPGISASESRLLAVIADRRPGTVVVVIDACRDDPFARGTRSVATRGLARVEPPARVFLIRSASPGEAALDRLPRGNDTSPNSVFTRLFAPSLKKPGARLTDVITEVRREVFALAESAGHQQFPDYSDRSLTPIVLVPASTSASGLTASAPVPQAAPAPPQAVASLPPPPALRRSFLPPEPVPVGPPRKGVSLFRECEQCPVMQVFGRGEAAMGRTEITFAEWDHCVAAKMCRAVDDLGQGRGSRPVSLVSFEDAQAYVKWLNITLGLAGPDGRSKAGFFVYRLPDFLEWWVAGTRKDGMAPGLFGDGRMTISPEMANYNWGLSFNGSPRGTPEKQALPVGSFPPGSSGFFDLIGNVREWTRSCEGDITKRFPKLTPEESARISQPDRECRSRLVVGGSFADDPRDLRSHALDPQGSLEVIGRLESPNERNVRTGFRVVRHLSTSN
jgi:formylglycine-generating enzyme required for sulfatase activity